MFWLKTQFVQFGLHIWIQLKFAIYINPNIVVLFCFSQNKHSPRKCHESIQHETTDFTWILTMKLLMDIFKEWSFSSELPFSAGVIKLYSTDFLGPLLNLAVQSDFEGSIHNAEGTETEGKKKISLKLLNK